MSFSTAARIARGWRRSTWTSPRTQGMRPSGGGRAHSLAVISFPPPLPRIWNPFFSIVSSGDSGEVKKDNDEGAAAGKAEEPGNPKKSTVDSPLGSPGDRNSGGGGGGGKGGDGRLPNWLVKWQEEFPASRSKSAESRRQAFRSGHRILRLGLERVFTPQANKILLLTGSAVLCMGSAEGAMLCRDVPFIESWDAGLFVARYAVEQLLPSIVWQTADADLVASALGMNPEEVLRHLDPSVAEDAAAMLRVRSLADGRAVVAGFMLIAQLVRGFYVSANAAKAYEDRIRNGDEPPLGGVRERIFRLNGVGSCVTDVSLNRYGEHVVPIFEDPAAVAHLVRLHSRNGKVPVYWRVNPRFYGNIFSWSRLPVDENVFLRTSTGKHILHLEADATNPDDPLALAREKSLDLTIDDASQGFRMIENLYRFGNLPPFRTMKILLANSLEEAHSGGGYSYTLRHRVRYAKEVDVLIDSRAPVITELLKWCDRVAGKNRMILVQTSSRRYFLSLQLLLRKFGYEVFDPLDWHMLRSSKEQEKEEKLAEEEQKEGDNIASKALRSLLSVLMDEKRFSSSDAVEKEGDISEDERDPKAQMTLVEFSKMPRLVYYEKTAETVNAVQALVNAGEVDVANCCALLDREEGMRLLEDSVLQSKPSLIERRMKEKKRRDVEAELANIEYREATVSKVTPQTVLKMTRKKKHLQKTLKALENNESSSSDSIHGTGLHIVCSAIIYDDLFRQVRQWSRMGYSPKNIQSELDRRYQHLIKDSGEVSLKVSASIEVDKEADALHETSSHAEMITTDAVSDAVAADAEHEHMGTTLPGTSDPPSTGLSGTAPVGSELVKKSRDNGREQER